MTDVWKRGALFLVWDEWGGFFGHVAPLSVPDANQSSDLDYAKRGKVVHTRFGHESILRMIEDRYRLAPLTVHDAKANSIAAAFDFARAPRREPRSFRRRRRSSRNRAGGGRPAVVAMALRLAGRPTSSIPQARRSDASEGCKGNERRPG